MSKLLQASILAALLTPLLVLVGNTESQAEPDEPALPSAHQKDIALLTGGVRKIAVPGIPGVLCISGPDAFPVVTARAGGHAVAVVAAARYRRGRVVAFGHNGWFGDLAQRDDTGRLLVNAFRWAAGKGAQRRDGPRVGVRDMRSLLDYLSEAGLDARALDGNQWTEPLKEYDVVFARLSRLSEDDLKNLRAFVTRGGGLVSGLPGWGWQQLNPGRDLATENPGNRLFAPAGFVWGSGLIDRPAGARLDVGPTPHALTHAGRALDALVARGGKGRDLSKADRALAVTTLSRAVNDLPPDDKILLPRIEKLLRGPAAKAAVPSAERPLTAASGLGKVLLALQTRRSRQLPPEKVKAHPASQHFPGEVPRRAARVERTLEIDTHVPDWHGTGLYAGPGEVVTITVPEAAVEARLELRIGAHKDRLWGKDTWRRAPEITRTFPVVSKTTRGASAFGGPIYVVVPRKCKLGILQVTIGGAVEAPRFVLGSTTLEAWRETIREHPAPWAEMEGRRVCLTVPSSAVRSLEDPEALMAFWDRVLDACADLASIPHDRSRPERYVTDEQISAGYMHSGYPIMTHLDAAPRFVDLGRVSTKGDWGMFHEMGHNHQQGDWTFGGTVEVTCNLFTLYVMETVCEGAKIHKALSPDSIRKKWKKHKEAGLPFDAWKRDPFLALIMYVQLKDAFGWGAFQQVFETYRNLPKNERPKNDAQKRDQWMIRFSRAVGRNLGPFFVSWGVPTSEAARAKIADLPGWMPESED